MRNREIGILLSSLIIIMLGSVGLIFSITQIKATVHGDAGSNVTLGTEVAMQIVDVKDDSYSTKEDENIVFYNHRLYPGYPLNNNLETASRVNLIYQGVEVVITDAILEKEAAQRNSILIMDYIFDYVDQVFLKPYGIDKTAYSYEMQRQYRNGENVYYAVFLIGDNIIQCTLGIELQDSPKLYSFSRDGLVDLCKPSKTPEEFRVENWCRSTSERENVYADYLQESQDFIVDILGMPSILTGVKDVDCISYFEVEKSYSNVILGYVLEDGTYIKLFYNRVNHMWNGFSIDGYHMDYVK